MFQNFETSAILCTLNAEQAVSSGCGPTSLIYILYSRLRNISILKHTYSTMKVFKKIRAQRADRKQAPKGKETDVAGAQAAVLDKAIFRGKGSGLQRTASSLAIPQSVTWSMSEEESVASTSNCTHSDTPHTDNSKHMQQRQSEAKAKAKHNHLSTNESELAKMKMVMEELREIHSGELAEKDEEIAGMKAALKETEHQLAQTIVEMSFKEDELQNREVALLDTEMNLQDTKQKLVVVSSCLMQHQEKLFEKEEELNNLRNVVNIGKGLVAGFFSSS